MVDRFNKEKSLQLKGVAIIFMLWLHLYGHDNLIQKDNYYTELWGGVTKFLLVLFHICVPVFLFIAGYGAAIKHKPSKPLVMKICSLYKKIWIVAIVFFPLAFSLGKLELHVGELLLNLSGFYYSYCGEWWFIGLYVLLEIYIYILEKIGISNNIKTLVVLSGCLMVAGYALKVINPSVTKINTVQWIPYTFLIKQPIFMSGYICNKKGVFNKTNVKKYGIFGIVTWGFLFVDIPESFYMPFVVPCFVAAFCCIPLCKVINKFLLLLGKNSTYMWLTHSWLIYKFLQPVIYGLHDVVANLIVLLVLDILSWK